MSINESAVSRDEGIDLLRFIGLSLIIFAHVSPPFFWFQLRNFDVPMMVMASGMAYALVTRGESPPLISIDYIAKRIVRLAFPVWLFLFFYFTLSFIFGTTTYTLKTVLESFLLINGIGYVWIIRIFLIIAVLAPMYLRLNRTLGNTQLFILISLMMLSLETWCKFSGNLPTVPSKIFEITFIYTLGYSICFLIGLRMTEWNNCILWRLALSSLLIFAIISIYFYFNDLGAFNMQKFKYPPQLYYLSYAIFLSTVIYIFRKSFIRLINALKFRSAFLFIARNSIWIYLWHIVYIENLNFEDYGTKYIVTYALSILSICFQIILVENISKVFGLSAARYRNIKNLLTG